jgi:serine/threonine protein kinase
MLTIQEIENTLPKQENHNLTCSSLPAITIRAHNNIKLHTAYGITMEPVLEFEWQRRELQAAAAGCNRKLPLHLSQMLPYFPHESVQTGKLLGSGTFSSVHQVIRMPSLEELDKLNKSKCNTSSNGRNIEDDTCSVTDCSEWIEEEDLSACAPRITAEASISIKDNDDDSDDNSIDKSITSLSSSSRRKRRILLRSASSITPDQTHTYALKRLHEVASGSDMDLKLRRAGEKDLLLEAGILAHLPTHENIIRLYALSDHFWEEPGSGFLILDQLTDTLHDRLQRWRRPTTGGPVLPKIPFYKPNAKLIRRQQEQSSRIQHTALGIARAMEFLHRHKVIYRDLKPQNVGFDAAGTVRLFDFGLARVHAEGARLLTGFTGSARYMAPEVARCEVYSFPADVHAFAILLWEISTLEKAYCKTVTLQQLVQQVVKRHVRPSMKKVASPITRELLEVSWHRDSAMRPSFALVVKQLEIEYESSFPLRRKICSKDAQGEELPPSPSSSSSSSNTIITRAPLAPSV